MELLRSLFRLRKPIYDPALGDQLGRVCLHEARQGKLDAALTTLHALREGEWDRRAFYIDLIGQELQTPSSAQALFPDTPLGNLIRGSYGIYNAWKARGSGTADTVEDMGWHLFSEHLKTAANSLLRSAEQDPQDPTPFAFLQTVAMGLQLDRPEAHAWFTEATRRDPLNQKAHFGHLVLLSKKWGGSHQEMYAFARETMMKAPSDSLLQCILYLAFQEHYLYLVNFDEDTAGARDFLSSKSTRTESIEVYQNALQKRQTIARVSDYWPHNVTAWWFYTLNIPSIVRQETKKIGPNFTKYPWGIFYRDAASGYLKALRV